MGDCNLASQRPAMLLSRSQKPVAKAMSPDARRELTSADFIDIASRIATQRLAQALQGFQTGANDTPRKLRFGPAAARTRSCGAGSTSRTSTNSLSNEPELPESVVP